MLLNLDRNKLLLACLMNDRSRSATATRRGLSRTSRALALAVLAGGAAAQTQPPAEDDDALQKLLDEMGILREEVGTLRTELDAYKRGDPPPPEDDPFVTLLEEGEEDTFFIPRRATEFADSDLPSTFGNIYTRPFLADDTQSQVSIGGYFDVEFFDPNDSQTNEFDQHRFVPFIYADVSDRVKVAAEVELEHGSELEVEFAQLDYLIDEAFNFRAGIMLVPLGKFNEVHDSPIQDLTFRPLVNQYIIPTTLRDAGVGAFGKLGDNVSYQFTMTNGFRGLDNAGNVAINKSSGLKNAAPQKDTLTDPFENTNDSFMYAGRLAVSPILGAEVGVSALTDHYDEGDDNRLTILALDGQIDGKAVDFLPDPLELLGEAAFANIDRDSFATASGVPNDMKGFYMQGNWHFGAEALEDVAALGDGAHFTFVTRYDVVQLDDYNHRRTTVGVNFRPNAAHTVFKVEFLMNTDSGPLAGTNDENAFAASAASYF